MKKTNIPTRLGLKSHKDLTGQASTITGGFRIDGSDDSFTAFSNAFTEDAQPGTYLVKHTFTAAGLYEVKFDSTNPDIGTHFAKVEVSDANIDDVKNAVDAVQVDVTGIKAVTDLLNTTELENLAEQITAVDTNLGNLTTLVDTVDANDGITSLRELLNDIQTGGVNVDSLINGQADIQSMIKGDEFLSDGTTANPLFGKGLDEIFDEIQSNLVAVDGYVTDAKDSIESNIAAFKLSVEAKVDDVKAVVDANAAILGDATFGNEAIKNAVDALSTLNTNQYDSVEAILNDATNGLAAVKTAIMDQLTAMDAKLDTILSNQDATRAIQVVI